MSTESFKRKLAAILSADVVGYSRLMGEDEESTIITLTEYRNIISSLIEKHRGRVVDSPGDNLLAEFTSVVDAVQCAVETQRKISKKNEKFQDNRKMKYRIGVNVGDVVEEGDRIYGDGVNITARLESLAEPGGICVSGFVYTQIKNRLKLGYEYMGEQSVKNIKEPVKAYWILSSTGNSQPPIPKAGVERMAYPLPNKPSIAILSFSNMSGDPSQDYIGDGLSESIISTLAKMGSMFIIAQNSSFIYKGKPVKVQQVAEELGVQYVLEGSFQKSKNRLRVTAQLIDALSGHHLWSDRYDREMKDLFDLQDEITKKIVLSLHIELTRGEAAIIESRSTESIEAWSNVSKGFDFFSKMNKVDMARAHELYENATKLDPGYATAWAWLALTHLETVRFGWSESPFDSIKLAKEYVQKALSIDDKDVQALIVQGMIYLNQRQHEKAIKTLKECVALYPNFAGAYAALTVVLYYSGQFVESVEAIKTTMRLGPYYPAYLLLYLGKNHFHMRQYEEAIEAFNQLDNRCQKGEGPIWWSLLGLSQVFAELGRENEARAYMARALKVNPNMSLERVDFVDSFENPTHRQRELDAYHKAGMQEGRQAVQEKPSIAVLPFVNLSNDPEQEYFSDGMAEELIGALAKLEGLKVISRTSAFFFKGKDVDLRTIGEKLRVDNVLEGSVRKAGNRLRISAQLIKVEDDTHLWADTYDRELKDVFAIQDEISEAIVKKLKVALLGMEEERLVKDYTKNTEAYDLFLKGRFFYSQGFSGFGKAIEYYEKTIKADPDFAPAYSKLAWAHFNNSAVFSLPSKEMWPKVNTLTVKALEIDEKDADAHAFMGKIKSCYEYNWPEAEINFKRAIELNPGNSVIHEHYGTYLIGVGRAIEAIEKMKLALELDPFSVWFHDSLGFSFYFARQFDKAIAQFQKTLELAPNDQVALMGLGASYGMKGIYEEGIKRLQQVKMTPRVTSWLGYLYGKAGRKDEAQKILDDLLEGSKDRYFWPVPIAIVYAGLKNMDKVFEWIEMAYEERNIDLWCIKVAPMLYDIHADRRWSKLMEKMGLED